MEFTMPSARKSLMLVMSFIVVLSPVANAGIIFGSLATPRQSSYALVGGSVGSLISTYITHEFPGSSFIGTQTLTPSFLSTIDVLIINSASDFTSGTFLSASEQSAVLNFILAGNGAIIVPDGAVSSAANSFGAPFGVTSGSGALATSIVVNPLHPVATGPFGTVTTFVTDPIGVATSFSNLGP
jgi:hypothetical protein